MCLLGNGLAENVGYVYVQQIFTTKNDVGLWNPSSKCFTPYKLSTTCFTGGESDWSLTQNDAALNTVFAEIQKCLYFKGKR